MPLKQVKSILMRVYEHADENLIANCLMKIEVDFIDPITLSLNFQTPKH